MPIQIMNLLMTQLKMRNPQMFQMLEKAQQNKSNPMELFKQVTSKYTPEQMNNLINVAKQYGVPDDIINQINGINAK